MGEMEDAIHGCVNLRQATRVAKHHAGRGSPEQDGGVDNEELCSREFAEGEEATAIPEGKSHCYKVVSSDQSRAECPTYQPGSEHQTASTVSSAAAPFSSN